RWAVELSAFRFRVKHIRGVDNTISDGLSRLLKAREIEAKTPEAVTTQESHLIAKGLDREEESDTEEEGVLYTDIDVTHALTTTITPTVEFSEDTIREEQIKDKFCVTTRNRLLSEEKNWKKIRKKF